MAEAAHINIGILAHVDAGKTTLAESILYLTGAIRKAGRVDHQDAFLDTDRLEKERGITIFSKMAQVRAGGLNITLLDTPGHVDFSAEMERTLQVLDYAILVISGADGVQGHVQTLWRLLKHYEIPTFLFINKMDQPGTDADQLMRELRRRLDDGCICFSMPESGSAPKTSQSGQLPEASRENSGEARLPDSSPAAAALALSGEALEEIAASDEALLEAYLEGEPLLLGGVRRVIRERKIFPCCFGSALRMTGVSDFLDRMVRCLCIPVYPEEFSARVYKILREGSERLTFLKVTGGTLKVKQMIGEEKADQLRLYSGSGFTGVKEAGAGMICAVTGLHSTKAGMGLGFSEDTQLPLLEPVLTYRVILPEGTDVHQAFAQLSALAEEIPELHLSWNDQDQTISVQVMGEVQIEILRELIRSRLGFSVDFSAGHIVYKETIAGEVEGVGHFEPLRHYAEVHLILQPGEPGSGITLESACSTDELDLNWQRLIFTHLTERSFPGVLTGSELTDVHIILAAGRAHIKHTEGGDFRQATYRALRHGLMQAESVLLEPVYAFTLEVPRENAGRAMADIQAMHGSFEGPFEEEDGVVLTGTAPAAKMQGYQMQVRTYTGGSGRLSVSLDGYRPCHNAAEVTEQIGYDPEADAANPAGSVFCSHGAGMYVPWQQVTEYMHLESVLERQQRLSRAEGRQEDTSLDREGTAAKTGETSGSGGRGIFTDAADDKELMEIFTRTYGEIRRERTGWKKSRSYGNSDPAPHRKKQAKEQVLLVDGYNIIHAWDELKDLAEENLDAARGRLMEILSNYQGYRQMLLIVVFDAYRVAGGMQHCEKYHNIYVVYTKEAETADAYIERTAHEMAASYDVTVATSDGAEQMIIWGAGASRMSAGDLLEEIRIACREIQEEYLKKSPGAKTYLFENVSEDMAALFEAVRLGRETM